MSIIDTLTDDKLKLVSAAIDKMESALGVYPHLRASKILSPQERHAIATLALAMDGPDGNPQR